MPRAEPAASPRDDAALVRAARNGGAAAFGQLVERYQHRIFNALLRFTGHEADALDLAQQAFLRALEALPTFGDRSTFYTWLYRIAMNLALSHRRAQRGPRAAAALPADHGAAGGSADPAEQAAQREAVARLSAALAELDTEFRAAVVLRDIEHMDYEQIAEVLQIPVGTAKSRVHRGRLLLKRMVE